MEVAPSYHSLSKQRVSRGLPIGAFRRDGDAAGRKPTLLHVVVHFRDQVLMADVYDQFVEVQNVSPFLSFRRVAVRPLYGGVIRKNRLYRVREHLVTLRNVRC
jgi:hypothetical protein